MREINVKRNFVLAAIFFNVLCWVFLFWAVPANASPLKVDWYTPYYKQAASMTLPSDNQIDTHFTLRGVVDSIKYKAVLVRVALNNDQVYYYYPLNQQAVAGEVYLRFGEGNYQIDVNLVTPSDNPALITFENLASFQVHNTKAGDKRYLLPSWGIESDDAAIKTKAEQLTNGTKGDLNKVKVLHEWVCKNMKYDMDKYLANQFYDNDGAAKALGTQKGLCRDYSNLLTAMCRALGMEAKTIIGEAGGAGSWYGHAWNEVKVNGKWINIDTVWDSGYIVKNKFVARYSETYFNTAAEVFNQTHRKTMDVY